MVKQCQCYETNGLWLAWVRRVMDKLGKFLSTPEVMDALERNTECILLVHPSLPEIIDLKQFIFPIYRFAQTTISFTKH